jgi:hypothetical protein
MPCTKLTVRRIQQFTDTWCGPACAHMILLSLNFLKNASKTTQGNLWTEIQQNTGTASAGFPLRETCGAAPPLEWATHPVALQKTLNARIGRHATDVIADADEDAIAGHALKSVKQGMASAVLVEDTTHWIVVFGCENSQRRNVPVLVNGDPVTHILARDPALSGFPMRMTLDAWAAAICSVRCGKFNQKYIVVGAS